MLDISRLYSPRSFIYFLYILRAWLFHSLHHPTNSLYSVCAVLKLEDFLKMEFAKFMFKFNNNTLPNSFNNYLLKLDKVHSYNTKQKARNVHFQSFAGLETGRKTLHHICLKLCRDIPQKYRHCSFFKFKKYFNTNVPSTYCASDYFFFTGSTVHVIDFLVFFFTCWFSTL